MVKKKNGAHTELQNKMPKADPTGSDDMKNNVKCESERRTIMERKQFWTSVTVNGFLAAVLGTMASAGIEGAAGMTAIWTVILAGAAAFTLGVNRLSQPKSTQVQQPEFKMVSSVKAPVRVREQKAA